jgi:hypothetical protein
MSSLRRFTRSNSKVFIAALLAMLVFAVCPSANVSAKDKRAKYGTIKLLTTPAGLFLTIDGKPRGETTSEYRAFDLEPGLHNLAITLPNGKLWTREIEVPAGRVKCVVVNYRPLPPLPKSPCPFPLNVSAPKQATDGEIVTYNADVAYSGDSPLKYNWKISPSGARIVSGSGSPTLTVDSTGLGNQRIIATLTVDDGSSDPTCVQTAQAVSLIAPIEKRAIVAQEFDECNSCTYDDQKARLDNLAVELQNDPATRAYIIAYGGRTSPLAQVERLMTRARDYLVAQRGIDASRIVVINGGLRETNSVELWIVPSGAAPPRATPKR